MEKEQKTYTKEQWFHIFKTHFNSCLNFWVNLLKAKGFDDIYARNKDRQNAVQELANLKHDPFVPNGREIPTKVLLEWLKHSN